MSQRGANGAGVQGALGDGRLVLAIKNFQREVAVGLSHATLSCKRWQVGFHVGCSNQVSTTEQQQGPGCRGRVKGRWKPLSVGGDRKVTGAGDAMLDGHSRASSYW